MNASSRKATQLLKDRTRTQRAIRKAQRQVATTTVLSAKTRLIAAGLNPNTAARFAGAFSTRVTPTAIAETVIKLKGRVTKRVGVKLYDLPTFTARLAVYRPKDKTAAAQFATLAAAA